MSVITHEELVRMLNDPGVPDAVIAPYLTIAGKGASGFDPVVRPNPERVAMPETAQAEVENAMGWGNALSRWRRQERFKARLIDGEKLPVVVSEGDSWFQFPLIIDDVIDNLGRNYLIWSLDAAGDTASNMAGPRAEYPSALKEQKNNGLRAFMFSAAGNDVIGEDEQGVPVLLKLLKEGVTGTDPNDYIDAAVLDATMSKLRQIYRKVIATVRDDADLTRLPIFIHGYDYPFPWGAPHDRRSPFWASRDEWLGAPLTERGIYGSAMRRSITSRLIDLLYDMLKEVAGDPDQTHVHLVDLRGTLPVIDLWADEIHPTSRGFSLVADRFASKMRKVIV